MWIDRLSFSNATWTENKKSKTWKQKQNEMALAATSRAGRTPPNRDRSWCVLFPRGVRPRLVACGPLCVQGTQPRCASCCRLRGRPSSSSGVHGIRSLVFFFVFVHALHLYLRPCSPSCSGVRLFSPSPLRRLTNRAASVTEASQNFERHVSWVDARRMNNGFKAFSS